MPRVTRSTKQFQMVGYSLPADVYECDDKDASPGFVLWLYGTNSRKENFASTLENLATQLEVPVVCFDYSGCGEAPFEFSKLTPAQHFLETITVYDELTAENGCPGGYVVGGSYGAYLLLQLLKYRKALAAVLRAPGLFRPRDFYTRFENINQEDKQLFREDIDELKQHPLLSRASKTTTPMLIVEHGKDEEIPEASIRAIRESIPQADYKLFPEAPHNLGGMTDAFYHDYEQSIIDWLKKV